MCVPWVRQTERPLLAIGQQVLPWARATPECRPGAPAWSEEQRARLDPQLTAALEAPHRLAHPAPRLTQGQAWPYGQIVNADAPTMAPIGTGNSHCPAPFGRKPGLIAAPAAGLIFAWPLPVGKPRDARSVAPWGDKVEQAMARVGTRPPPAIHALAGDLARTAATWREALPAPGMLTGGLPRTVDPLPLSPTPEDVLRPLEEADLHHIRTPSPGHLAYACGYRRPVGESLMASLLGRGAARLTDTGHRGALIQTGMAVMAHHAATVVRLHASRLSKRARTCRRRLRWRCRQVNQCHASIN